MTCSPCRTHGSTRGTRRGIWPSTASLSRTSIPTSPSSSCCCCCREWYMHPNGQLPAYEWNFSDVNPPVHAWAALRVFEDRRRHRLRLPRAGVPQAAAQLHVVGQPQGRTRATTCSRAGSSVSTTSVRSTAPKLPPTRRARADRRHGVDGDVLPRLARDRAPCSRRTTPLTRTSRRSSSSISRTSRQPLNEQGLWDDDGRVLLRRAAHRRGRRRTAAGRARSSDCSR